MRVLIVGSGGARACAGLEARCGTWRRRGRLRTRQRRHRARSRRRSRSTPAIRRRCSISPRASASISPIVGPELPLDRGIVDLFAAARPADLRSDPRRGTARVQQGIREGRSWRATGFRRRAIGPATTREARTRCWPGASSACRSSSRLTGSPPARASSSRPIARRPIARFARRWRSGSSATPARGSCSKNASSGPEVSFFALCDGRRAVPLRSAQDHKRVFDGDRGAEHRRHGRVLAEPAGRRGDAGDRSCARSSSRSLRGLARRGQPSTADSCTPG